MLKKDICIGCKAKDPNTMTIEGPMICELQPEFNENKCPCSVCLVKVTCTKFDYECNTYFQFAKQQFKKPKTEKLDIPCKTCDKWDKCKEKLVELRIKLYGENLDYIGELEDYLFHTDMMERLCKDCDIIYNYFPFDVVSRDGLMVQSNDNNPHKHHDATKIKSLDENEWLRRNEILFGFLSPYNVMSDENDYI
jgi:hypothetical protein